MAAHQWGNPVTEGREVIDTVLMIVACVCFALAAFNVKAPIHLGWAGLFAWALTVLI